MSKLIIDNRSELSDLDSLELVKIVVNLGRISNDNKQYCYVTVVTYNHKEYFVSTHLNKKSDRFVIMKN